MMGGTATDGIQLPWRLVDMHCHPEQLANGSEVASDAEPDLGTASFMPPIMGQMIAGEVLRHISGLGEGDDVSAALAMHDAAQKGQLAGKRGGRAS